MLAPAPPVFAGSLQSVLQSDPRHCALAHGANIMQTNTSLLFGTSRAPTRHGGGKREKAHRRERREGKKGWGWLLGELGRERELEFISVIT